MTETPIPNLYVQMQLEQIRYCIRMPDRRTLAVTRECGKYLLGIYTDSMTGGFMTRAELNYWLARSKAAFIPNTLNL